MQRELSDSLASLEEILLKVVSDVQFIQEKEQKLVYKSDTEAARMTGLGRDYWERIRHLVPHIIVPAKEHGKPDSIVYPIEGVRQWLNEHQEFY